MEATKTDDFIVSKSLEGNDQSIDWSKVKDLYDDDEMINEIENEGDIVFEEEETKEREAKKKNQKHLNKKQIKELEDSEFLKSYTRAGGV